MSARAFLERRLVLKAVLLGAAAVVSVRGAALVLRSEQPAGGGFAAWAAGCIPGGCLPPDLGARYLDGEVAEASIPALLARIRERWPEGTQDLVNLPLRRLYRALAAIVQRDLERADVVLVDGWVLARSEARLYALAHLVRRSDRSIWY